PGPSRISTRPRFSMFSTRDNRSASHFAGLTSYSSRRVASTVCREQGCWSSCQIRAPTSFSSKYTPSRRPSITVCAPPGCGSSVETCCGLATSTAAVVSLLLIGRSLRAVELNKLGDLRQLVQITLAVQAHHGSPFQKQP